MLQPDALVLEQKEPVKMGELPHELPVLLLSSSLPSLQLAF
jgi:hypothetical protein